MDLTEKIQNKQQEMYRVALSKGFTAPETLEVSRQLDALINQAMNITNK